MILAGRLFLSGAFYEIRNHKERILKNLSLRFILALAFLTIFSTFSFIIYLQTIKMSEEDARFINLSGGQRFHSQRIALFAVLASTAEDVSMKESCLKIMRTETELMEKEHNILVHDPSLSEHYQSQEILSIYYQKPVLLEKIIHSYFNEANAIINDDLEVVVPKNHHLAALVEKSNEVLMGTNRVVEQYQKENEDDIVLFNYIKTGSYVITLLLLCLVGWFLFLPSLTEIRNNLDKIDRQEQELILVNTGLEETVNQRTSSLADLNLLLKKEVEMHKETEHHLAEKNKELDAFFHRAHHDLKGPVASLMGLLNLIKMESGKESLTGYHDLLNKNVHRLNELISDLSVISKIKSGSLDIRETIPHQVISDVLSNLQFMPGYKDIDFITDLSEKTKLNTDYKLFYSIIQNLIENAIKYKKPGNNSWVKIQSVQWGKGIKIIISDNGCGMNETVRRKAFNMFYRGNEKSQGTGLGLYIVNNTIEKLGGTIRLESREGEGTSFEVILPSLESDPNLATSIN